MGRHAATPPPRRRREARRHVRQRRDARRTPLAVVGRIAVVVAMLTTFASSALGTDASGAATTVEDPRPSTEGALTSSVEAAAPPASLVPPPSRDSDRVSRSAPRAEFRTDTGATVTCSGIVPDVGTNGHVPDSSLCDLWQKPYRDRADAVVTLTALNDRYTAKFGEPMCLTSAYRTLEQQAALRRTEPGLAAPVGRSNHGWGLAVDFCRETYTGAHGAWLASNGPVGNWDNPAWARRGGSGPYEPWHWEYVPGVKALVAAGLE